MRILIIGNLAGQLAAASIIAKQRGAAVRQVPDLDAALRELRSGQGADLLLADINSNIPLIIENLAAERMVLPVIACGIGTEEQAAVDAIKAGAVEYLSLPPNEELIAALLNSLSDDRQELVYTAPSMANVVALAKKIADSTATILVTGESGTGKEVLARYLHHHSSRSKAAFIAINCAAIPDNLLESELFGHEKGAFTGAISRRIGKFEEAQKGTILLDEISEIDLRLQAKLLRVLQERELVRVGGNEVVKLNVRVIATSNRNLLQSVKQGHFREDLYYRLNVINLMIPALRERREDIMPIALHYLRLYSNLNKVNVYEFSVDAEKILKTYNWPGNVRELENTIHRAVLLADGKTIEPKDLLLNNNHEATEEFMPLSLAELESEHIKRTYKYCGKNPIKAAQLLGVSVRMLEEKLETIDS